MFPSLSLFLPFSLRSEGPHVLSVKTLWELVLWEGNEAFRSAMLDFMGTRLVPQYNLPWYTIDRMRLYQTMERTARPQGPADAQGGVGRARVGMPFMARGTHTLWTDATVDGRRRPSTRTRPQGRLPGRGPMARAGGGHGFSVGGLSLEERKVRSMERVAAAQEAAFEQEQLPETHSKIMGNPRANHPNYLIRRFLLIACGRYPEGGLSEGRRGESYLTLLWTTLQDSYEFYRAWPQITFTVTVRHFMAASRGYLGALPIGSFTDTPLH